MWTFQSGGKRLSTKDLVYLELKNRIIEGFLKPNQSVNEDQLAAELEVSRTPVREAVQRLETEELIIRLPNGRLKVAPISAREVNEIFAVRGLLEGLVAKEAIQKAGDEDIRELGEITVKIVEAAEQDRRSDVVRYGSEFHAFLYRLSGNKTAAKILNQLNDHIARYRRLGPTRNLERSRQAAREHQEMFEAARNRDATLVEELMRRHISNSLAAAIESIGHYLAENNAQED